MTIYSQTGLTVSVYESLAAGTTQLFDMTDAISGLRFTIQADGGYWNGSISLAGTQDEIEDWIANGLSRRILIYNPTGVIVWEGFVNSLSASVGTRGVRLGPLLNAPNRIKVVYTPKDITVAPPILGTSTTYGPVNNTTAQSRYGIVERVLNGGEITDSDVAQFASTYLAEYAQPVSSEEIRLSGAGSPTVTLDLAGYSQWMNAYTYSNTTEGTVTLTARIQALMAGNPNGTMYSTDYSLIGTNAATIEQYTNDDKPAYALVKEAVVRGDANYDRWTFGMYAERRGVYAAVPTTQEYTHEITAAEVAIRGYQNGNPVDPWDVLPARWVFVPDFLIGRVEATSSLRLDPRNVFIESLTYTAPFDLTLSGSRVSTFTTNQMAVSLGIGGLGGT